MHFLTMSNANVDFQAWDLQWRSYTTRDVFPTLRQVKLIRKTKFIAVIFDLKYKAFIIHIASLNLNSNNEVHPSKKAQIAYLKVDKVSTKVSNEYANFVDVFLPKLAIELPKYMRIKNHTIELVNN